MINILYSLFFFLLAIALLITVHEFGHFWVARRCGVKVLRFSIGFGKPLWRKIGKDGTEYVLAAIPFGGYVKMLDETEGEVAADQKHLAFNLKPLWQRISVVCAGPLFNMLFAVAAYWLMFIVGVTSIAPIVGQVEANSIAAAAGIHSQQEIISIDNKATYDWQDVRLALLSHIGSSARLNLKLKDLNNQSETTAVMDLSNWQLDEQVPNPLASLGLSPYLPKIPPVLGGVTSGMPAELAGLQAGDRIVSFDGQRSDDWVEIVDHIKANPNHSIILGIERGDLNLDINVTPMLQKNQQSEDIGVIGAQSETITWPEELIRQKNYGIFPALGAGLKETSKMTGLTFQLLGKMLRGHISARSISGPIGIAIGAGQTAEGGLAYYLGFLALVSISLGVLNILPIPVLDGGHLLYYIIEGLRGKPLSQQVQMAGFRLGLFLIFGLMLLAIYNDVSRLLV